MSETFKTKMMFPDLGNNCKVLIESPFEKELQVLERTDCEVIEWDCGICVLVGRVAADESWPCWVGASTDGDLKEQITERFRAYPNLLRAIVLPCDTDSEAALMARELARMLTVGTNPVLAAPAVHWSRPVPALDAMIRVLGCSGHFVDDPVEDAPPPVKQPSQPWNPAG